MLLLGSMFGQSSVEPKRNEVVSERHSNGLKKLVLVFEGEGLDEVLVAKYGFYNDGLKSYIKNYNNNVLNGKSIKWYDNGNKAFEGEFENNKKIGLHQEWYENGNLESSTNYSYDKKNGKYQKFDREGNIYIEGEYNDNVKNGKWIEKDYRFKYDSNYLNGTLEGESNSYEINTGKKILSGNYKTGKKHGKWIMWFGDGNKKSEIIYDNGNIIKKQEFYNNGGKKLEYIKGKGGIQITKEFYDNGSIKSETSKDVKENKINKWIFFNQDNSIDEATFYFHNKNNTSSLTIIDAIEKGIWKLEEHEKYGYKILLEKQKKLEEEKN